MIYSQLTLHQLTILAAMTVSMVGVVIVSVGVAMSAMRVTVTYRTETTRLVIPPTQVTASP